ncbi:hypothetical protein FBEOM_2590 [Fusarium beomiforme]|uniref:Uncharacterized protein n=1 Tax=Fusarium beomiforme TaxID=44412 RepID=A0A9P5ARJ4_9HYPO|nr:hypothetical protein FBEOM_2590 [Fusarium beomiforme]
MPIPKTDKEIMASWSAEEREFYEWTESNKEKILDTQRIGVEWNAYPKMMKRAWPDPGFLDRYNEWSHNWYGRIFRRNKYAMNTEDFIEMINQGNFLDKSKEIIRNIKIYSKPFVPIGETSFGDVFTGFAFTPSTNFLEPKFLENDGDVISNMILALNTHVPFNNSDPPRSLSVLLGLGLSTASSMCSALHKKDSAARGLLPVPHQQNKDFGDTGSNSAPQNFVFAQFGMLWAYTGNWEDARQGDPAADKQRRWKPNGFAVVVRLSPRGKAGEVYVLCHPNPTKQLKKIEDDLVGKPKSRTRRKSKFKPGFVLDSYTHGYPHPQSNSFWFAKVANSFQELGSFKNRFEFDVVSSNEIHAVRI